MNLIACMLTLATVAMAQVTGRVSGLVTDPSTGAIGGARITLVLDGGVAPLAEAVTTSEGLFLISGVAAGRYRLKVEAPGFSTHELGPIKIDAAQQLSLPPIGLQLATTSQTMTVSGEPPLVQTANTEVSLSVTPEQFRFLPNIGRGATSLIFTQVGVPNYFIHGQRPWLTNITLDGINIQGNYIRASGTNLTTQLFQDQVSEVTVTTSNVNPSQGNGTSQIMLVTPSGTNQFHGAAYWANRNAVLGANAWFNNRDRIRKPPFNLNYFGFRFGGPILRDRVLFYINYEGMRFPQTGASTRTILTEDARRGIFTYEDLQGQVRKLNVLQAMGVGRDPYMERLLALVPGADRINNFRVGDSREDLLKNTAGYSFGARSRTNQDNVSLKLDYIPSSRHQITGSYVFSNRLLTGRSAQFGNPTEGYDIDPPISADYNQQLVSLGWRWNPTPRLTTEVTGGFYVSPSGYVNQTKLDRLLVSSTLYSSPVMTLRTAEEISRSYHYANRSTYVNGRQNLQFGFQLQQMRVRLLDEAGITPVYNIGIGAGNPGLMSAELPGIRPQDLISANQLLATLTGYVSDYMQTFNIAGRSSGFVNGVPFLRRYATHNLAFYIQENWKLARRLTVNLGLRHDYYGIPNERDSLMLLPRMGDRDAAAALRSNATLDFAGASAGRRLYDRDVNNFAPNIGLAWDLTGDGKTALRAGYSVHFVSDEHLRNVQSSADQNFGLTATVVQSGLAGRVSSGLPAISVAAFEVPRRASDNYARNRQSSLVAIDPRLRTPYFQTWSIGIQRQLLADSVLEIRYVGNHGVKLMGPIDLNQIVLRDNGFLADFELALNNGNLAQSATGVFNPNYSSSIAGSQPLTVFPLLQQGGLLNQASVRSMIQTGQPGQLASFYQINGFSGGVRFFPNPHTLSALLLTNQGQSAHNALEVDFRRRARGAVFQFNYTYAKTLENWGGPFMDDNNRTIQRARQISDQTHRLKANAIYDLPIGQGHRLDFRPMRFLLGGWTASTTMSDTSGFPFSVVSGRGTLNRAALSGANMASSPFHKSQLDHLFYFRQTGGGPYFIDPSVVGRDGRAAGPDTAPFPGQAFFHPGPSTVGTLQRNMFSGPWIFNVNAALIKKTRIRERQSLEFRMDSANILNHPSWVIGGTQRIDSPTFGILTTAGGRTIQVGLRYQF
ncbi:MAG: TonB-dependent receptor [Acidobacteria bacterium]|nr:TonB-dependent receptor [Acidobacteriota bacterium]